MTAELYWLILTTAMTGLLWIPYIINRVIELGPPPAAWFPAPDPQPRAAWAARAMRAHLNAIENQVVFAPLVLAIYATGISTPITAGACKVYFFARLAHFFICVSGVPVIARTAAFLVGVGAQLTLVVILLQSAGG